MAFWRQLAFGLSTVLGLKARGFFIPYRYAASVEPLDYPALRPLFDAAQPRFEAILNQIDVLSNDLKAIQLGDGPARFDQDWFPRLDAAAAYSVVRTYKPRRIVEIGSGHSTRFLARAAQDGALPTEIICIDPSPRADLARLHVKHSAVLLHDADPAVFAALGSGDILFIDSSHIAMPGSDVDRLFLDVLPRLAPGALVHIHDVTLPYAYPAIWKWRGYSEQICVGTLLQGGAYELVFASQFVARELLPTRAGILSQLPLSPTAHETSLWLRKR